MVYSGNKRGSKVPSFDDLVRQDLKTGKFRPVYLLSGEDVLRKEGVVEHLKKKVLGEGGCAFNYHVMNGVGGGLGKILQQAVSYPMLGSHQIIWVRSIEACLQDQQSQERLQEYFQKPVLKTILIIGIEKADRRKKWVKNALELGYFFDFSPPTGEALINWVLKAAQKERLELPIEAARILCELVGNDLLSLKGEIDKLALLQEDRGVPLEAAEIGRIIMDQAALEGYEITANLEPGKCKEVLNTWFRLTQWGKSAYEISPLLLSRIRKGALVASCQEKGFSNEEIGLRTASNVWSLRYLQPMIKGMGSKGIAEALRAAKVCDQQMKGSPLPPDLVLEQTIFKCCLKRK
ncbi:MAG: DNA polymerase III subunit delta [Gemmatimonadales bacterium]|nr:DNA polymerase III subunit delta [Gemmatimonadales bacterium]